MKQTILTVAVVAMASIAALGQSLSGNPDAARKARQARKMARTTVFQPAAANISTRVAASEYNFDDAIYGESNTNTTQSGQANYGDCEMNSNAKTYKGTRSGGYGSANHYSRLYKDLTPQQASREMTQGAVGAIISNIFKGL